MNTSRRNSSLLLQMKLFRLRQSGKIIQVEYFWRKIFWNEEESAGQTCRLETNKYMVFYKKPYKIF